MKIEVLQENLVKGLTAVARVTGGGKLPILNHVLMRAEKTGLWLVGTDLETGMMIKVGAKVEKEGVVAIPARLLTELVTSLNPGKVTLEGDEEKINIKGGGVTASLQGMPGGEFPVLPIKIEKERCRLSGKDIEGLDRVIFAAGTDESRPVLTGVQFKQEDKELRLAATDGYRLSVTKVKASGDGWMMVVPAKALGEVVGLWRGYKGEGEVVVGVNEGENQAIFGFGEVMVTTRLLEGEFPAFEQIVPQKSETVVTLQREELVGAVKAAAIFARESANIVRWEIGKSEVKIQANSPQVGEETSRVEAVIEGEGGKIAFNSRYLLEFLGAIKGEGGKEVTLGINGALNPGLFKLKGEEGFTHVIMPVRVQE